MRRLFMAESIPLARLSTEIDPKWRSVNLTLSHLGCHPEQVASLCNSLIWGRIPRYSGIRAASIAPSAL